MGPQIPMSLMLKIEFGKFNNIDSAKEEKGLSCGKQFRQHVHKTAVALGTAQHLRISPRGTLVWLKTHGRVFQMWKPRHWCRECLSMKDLCGPWSSARELASKGENVPTL